jgi:hypothetical protein
MTFNTCCFFEDSHSTAIHPLFLQLWGYLLLLVYMYTMLRKFKIHNFLQYWVFKYLRRTFEDCAFCCIFYHVYKKLLNLCFCMLLTVRRRHGPIVQLVADLSCICYWVLQFSGLKPSIKFFPYDPLHRHIRPTLPLLSLCNMSTCSETILLVSPGQQKYEEIIWRDPLLITH